MKKSNLVPVTAEMLTGLAHGTVINEYCFFKNVIFDRIDGDYVILNSKGGDQKRDPIWLFLKHAKIEKIDIL